MLPQVPDAIPHSCHCMHYLRLIALLDPGDEVGPADELDGCALEEQLPLPLSRYPRGRRRSRGWGVCRRGRLRGR